jgi:predicted RNase H-like HicB family nuclease
MSIKHWPCWSAETLEQLLIRLETAIEKAIEKAIENEEYGC